MARKLNFYHLSIFILFINQHNQAMKPADVERSIDKANDKYNERIEKITKKYDVSAEKSHNKYLDEHKNITGIRDHILSDNKPNNKERIEKRKLDREAIEKTKQQQKNEADEAYKQSSVEWIQSGKTIFITDINTREKADAPHPHFTRANSIKRIEEDYQKKYDDLDRIYNEGATKEQEQSQYIKNKAELKFAAEHINIFTIYNNTDDKYQEILSRKKIAATKKHCKSINKIREDFFSAHPELISEFSSKSNKETVESVSPLTSTSTSLLLLTKEAIKSIKPTKEPTLKRKTDTATIDHDHTYDLRDIKKPRKTLSKTE